MTARGYDVIVVGLGAHGSATLHELAARESRLDQLLAVLEGAVHLIPGTQVVAASVEPEAVRIVDVRRSLERQLTTARRVMTCEFIPGDSLHAGR